MNMIPIPRFLEVLFVAALLLISAGAFAPLWTDPAAHNAIDGQTTLQATWAIVYLATALVLISHRAAVLTVLRAQGLLITLLLFSFSSALWSENPAVTLRKAVALLGTTMIGVLFSVRFNVREQVRFIAVTMSIAAVLSVAAAIWFPQLFPATEFASGAWNGVFSHKNVLGRAMALGVLACITLSRQSLFSWPWTIGGTALCGCVMLLAHSQTALIALLVTLLVWSASGMLRADWRVSVGTSSLLSVVGGALLWTAFTHLDAIAELLHRDTTFTGRTRIWLFAQLSIAERPWAGYGYGAFWWVSRKSQQALALIGYETPHAHNGILDLMLQIGVIGTGIFTLCWAACATRSLRNLRHTDGPEGKWPLLYTVFFLLYSLTENGLLVANSLLWIVFVAAACSVGERAAVVSRQTACDPELASIV
jgi:exopolysaccharide production protein ExoQ